MSLINGTVYDKQSKIWHGPVPETPLFHPDCSLGRVLFQMMKLNPKAVALESDTEKISVTYEELLIDSIRIAEHLSELAPNQDDIVGIVSGDIICATHVICACWFNAIAVHPVYPELKQDVVQHLFGITRPKIIFCEGKYYAKVLKSCQQLQLEVPIYTINDHIESVRGLLDLMKPTGTEKSYIPKELMHGGDQTVCILNTSGSTGAPKAVCKSKSSLYSYILSLMLGSDVVFSFSGLDWLTATLFIVSSIMVCAKRIITTAPFTPEYLKELLEKYKITNIFLLPSHLAGFVNTPNIAQSISSLRIVTTGGAIISVPIYQKFRKLLQPQQILFNDYTCSEFSSFVSCNDNAEKPNAVGQIMPGVKVKIIADDGRQLGVGEIGEVVVYDGKTWNGYFNNPLATLEMCDNELWFHTGDLGYFDQDGDLFIVDRKTDVMKYRGVHYTPQEIEQVIAQLLDVVEVCVFGITDYIEGDHAAAAIVKQKDSKLTEDEVVQYVASQFEVEWKRLHGGVFFMDSLPKAGNGKASRRFIKKKALQPEFNMN